MAAGIGVDAGQREADLVSNTSVQVMEALINLLKALASKKDYSFSDVNDKGMKAITDHIRKGGKVRQSIIDKKDAAIFEQAFRAYHIPYAQVEWKDAEGEEKRVYFTRDGAADGTRTALPSDARLLEEAWKMFALRMREGLNEITVEEFLRAAEGQEAVRLCGLTPEERELFRRTMAGRNGSYAFADGDEPQTTDILYLKKDEAQIDRAFKDVCYAFSGRDGKEYRRLLRTDLKARDSFYENALPAGNETVFLVDAEKPNEFIAVTRSGYSTHSIQAGKNSGSAETCEDRDGRLFHTHRDLMRYVEQLKKPVILQAEEFPLVKGFLRDGRADAPDYQEAREIFRELKETLSDRPFYRGITENEELFKDTDGKRKELYAVHSSNDDGYAKLNDRQKEALSRVFEKHTEESVIDRDTTQRVMDAEYSSRVYGRKGADIDR